MAISGTCIVALTDGSTLAIAADSLAADAMDPSSSRSLVCKIFTASGFVCTGAGLMEELNTDFTVKAAFLEACNRFSTLADIGVFVDAEVQRGMATFISGCKIELPEYYERLKCNPVLINVFLAGVVRGQPTLRVTECRLEEGDEVRVAQIPAAPIMHIDHGHTLASFLSTHPDFVPQSRSLPEAAACLVQIACEGNTTVVGGPVDVVAIDATGVHWVQRKAGC